MYEILKFKKKVMHRQMEYNRGPRNKPPVTASDSQQRNQSEVGEKAASPGCEETRDPHAEEQSQIRISHPI